MNYIHKMTGVLDTGGMCRWFRWIHQGCRRRGVRAIVVLLALTAGGTGSVTAQTLRFHLHREIEVPEYAFVRVGPFYSDIRFSQSAGFRYTRSRGAGTDYLRGQRRGRIREDGADLPLYSTLDFRNYLLLSRNADIDFSVRMRYEHYPLGTQDDQFLIILPEEGIEGSFSAGYRFSPYLRAMLYDRFRWRTDYVDTRGLTDDLGGRKYESFDNVIGLDVDWLPAEGKNVSLALSRNDHWPQSRAFRDQEHVTHLQALSYSQQLLPYLSGGARATFEQVDYAARERTDYDRQLYAMFAEMAITRRVTGTGWVGYSIIRLTSAGDGDDREREGVDWGGTLHAGEGFWVWVPRLTHEIEVSRTVDRGFDTAYQTVDRYRYRMGWEGDALRAGLTAQRINVDPSARSVSEYSDTSYTLDASYPITSFARLNGATGYTLRRNRGSEAGDGTQSVAVDRANDYETFFWRVGTSFNVTRRIVFDTWFHHSERFSDAEELQFARDTFQAMFTFSHRF